MLRTYLKLLFRTAFRIWNLHEAATVLIAAALATALAWLSAHELEVFFGITLSNSTFAVFVFLWFVLIVLVLAPYQIWKEYHRKSEAAESPRRSRIGFGSVHYQDSPERSDDEIQSVYISVENVDLNKRELKNCLAAIATYEDDFGQRTRFPYKSLRTMYQNPQRSGPFNLRAGQPKYILVAKLKKGEHDCI